MTLFTRLTLAIALIASCSTALADGVTPFGDVLYWHASAEALVRLVKRRLRRFFVLRRKRAVRLESGLPGRIRAPTATIKSWDVKLYWTYFRTSQDAQVAIEDGQTGAVVPEFFSGFVGSTFDGIPHLQPRHRSTGA